MIEDSLYPSKEGGQLGVPISEDMGTSMNDRSLADIKSRSLMLSVEDGATSSVHGFTHSK